MNYELEIDYNVYNHKNFYEFYSKWTNSCFKISYLMMQEEWYKVETKQDTADRAMNIFCEVGKTSWRGDKYRSTTTEGSFWQQSPNFSAGMFLHLSCILDHIFYETTQGYCPYQVHLLRHLWSWVLSYCRLVQQCMKSQIK